MAKRNEEVLNKVNTLNTNLENANIAEIEKNISSRLFNVLDWANSISVDSELYTSINDVTNASDIIARISRITLDTELNVNWENIANTGDLPHGTAAQTQASIDKITQSENDLTTLESNIKNLSDRLSENITKLRDIADEQHFITTPARGISIIDSDLTLQDWIKWRIDTILKILWKIITELNKTGGGDPAVLSGLRNDFMIADKTWIPPAMQTLPTTLDVTQLSVITNRESQYVTLLNNTNNRISELNHEKKLRSHIDSLNKIPIHVQNWFLPTPAFDDASTVASEWANEAATRASITGFNQRITRLNTLQTEIPNIRARYAEHKNRLNRILQLQRLQERLNTHPETTLRQEEFQAISDISYHNLLLWPTVAWRTRLPGTYQPNLPNTVTTIGCTPTVVPLNFIHGTLVRPWRFDYTLCDSEGNPLRRNWGNFEYQLWAQTISLEWITFQNNVVANQIMTIDNLQINPVEWLTFPLSLDLNVRVRIHDDGTWLDIDHHKPIHLEIARPTLAQADREHAYDSLVPPMNDRIQAEYSDHYRENLENEAIWNILREWWNQDEVNEIYNNETRRNLFIDRIRTTLAWHIPLLSLALLQTNFRDNMTDENRNVPVQYLLWQPEFQNYVRHDFPNNLRNYASEQILRGARTYRDDILNEFVTFQADIANSPKDNLDNLRALAQVPPDNNWPQWHPNTYWQRIAQTLGWTGDRNIKNNYTKFFQGRGAEFNDLSLETEDWPIKYSVNVQVPWVNKIVATINIEWKDEPEIIEASSHDRLIRWILNRGGTKDWEPLNRKLRCNIALSVLKAMVTMSPQRLNRQIPVHPFVDNRWHNVNCDRVEAYVRWWNLRIRASNAARHNVTIFDEEQFKSLHDVDMLENWIHELSTQINMIMNATAQEYDEATSTMTRNIRNRYIMQYNTAQRLRWGPIKRLRWRMLHGRTSNNFNFDTSVNEAWKSININMHKGFFTVSWDFDGQHYEYRGRNLWSILRKKINRKRVFDWVELAMLAAINENFIQRLRENHWVQTENFVISDSNLGKTWRTYIFDAAWDLSYLEIEDNNLNPLWAGQSGRIDPAQVPTHRVRCNDVERREFMQNPLLAWRLQREMRRRLSLF